VLAISRLYSITSAPASLLAHARMKLGQLALFYGCDDMGGTIIEEQVVHDAGSTNEATRRDLEKTIIGAGFRPVIRRHVLELRHDVALATAS